MKTTDSNLKAMSTTQVKLYVGIGIFEECIKEDVKKKEKGMTKRTHCIC